MGDINSPSQWQDNLLEMLKLLIGWCFAPIILTVAAILFFCKFLVIQLAKIVHPDLIPISNQDTSFILDKITEQDQVELEEERVPLNVIGFYIKISAGNKTDLNEFKRRMLERVIENKSDYNWKLKSYLVRFCGYNFWKKCSDFNIDNHVKKLYLKSDEGIDGFMSDWSRKPFPLRTPLWELNFIDIGDQEYLALKVHHALGDGLSIIDLVIPIFDNQKHHPRVEEIVKSSPPRISPTDKVKLIIRLPWLLLDWIFLICQTPDPFPSTDFSPNPNSKNQSGQWVSLNCMKVSDIKSISKSQNVGFITVLMCVYAGAIRRYLDAQGNPIPKFLVIPAPQPWPGRPKNFIGNSWSVLYVPVQINNPDPLQRLQQLQSNIANYYYSGSFFMFKYVMMNVLACLPNTLHSWFRNLVCVRYAITPMLTNDQCSFYDGRTAETIQGIVGLVHETFKLIVVTASFNETLTWTITGSKDVFSSQGDLNLLTQKYISAEVDDLIQATRSKERTKSA